MRGECLVLGQLEVPSRILRRSMGRRVGSEQRRARGSACSIAVTASVTERVAVEIRSSRRRYQHAPSVSIGDDDEWPPRRLEEATGGRAVSRVAGGEPRSRGGPPPRRWRPVPESAGSPSSRVAYSTPRSRSGAVHRPRSCSSYPRRTGSGLTWNAASSQMPIRDTARTATPHPGSSSPHIRSIAARARRLLRSVHPDDDRLHERSSRWVVRSDFLVAVCPGTQPLSPCAQVKTRATIAAVAVAMRMPAKAVVRMSRAVARTRCVFSSRLRCRELRIEVCITSRCL